MHNRAGGVRQQRHRAAGDSGKDPGLRGLWCRGDTAFCRAGAVLHVPVRAQGYRLLQRFALHALFHPRYRDPRA